MTEGAHRGESSFVRPSAQRPAPSAQRPAPSAQRRPSIPREAGGLIAALDAARRGDDGPLERWNRGAREVLWHSLRRSGLDAASADDAVTHVLERAFHAVAKGRRIASEPAWIAAVAASVRGAARRQTARERKLRVAAVREVFIAADPLAAAEHREVLIAAARRLPPPYAHICVMRGIAGRTAPQIAAALRSWRPVGADQARKLQRAATRMLAAVLAGADPRREWPRRFSEKSAWIGTPLPPLETLWGENSA